MKSFPLTHIKTLWGGRKLGFTLIETLAAISLLSIAIVAPMTLASRSLAASYYARDQVVAFYLAQEAIEALRSVRDSQILQIVQGGSSINIFGPIPLNQPFIIDARKGGFSGVADLPLCNGTCRALQTDGTLYGYQDGWQDTAFTRTVRASLVNNSNDQLRVTVTVSWKTGAFQVRTFSISEDMYRWIEDAS